ncbi:MAG TPA: response regulator [Steroidobacteraceae bacterium]|nr:response regulator [Steroidobacteraceae bacterium]
MAKKVLIVDDSESVRMIARIALREQGYEVVEAANGVEALRQLDAGRVHLVISDVNMPEMDGITLLKQIKASVQHKFTPIIMLTTEAGQDKKDEGRAAGARAWITKPFQPNTLVAAVSKLMPAGA